MSRRRQARGQGIWPLAAVAVFAAWFTAPLWDSGGLVFVADVSGYRIFAFDEELKRHVFTINQAAISEELTFDLSTAGVSGEHDVTLFAGDESLSLTYDAP